MTLTLTIGATDLAYTIRQSTKATRKRLVVTPEGIEAVVPTGTPMEGPDGRLAFACRMPSICGDPVAETGSRAA